MFPGMTSVKDWRSKIMQEKINCKPVETEASMDCTQSLVQAALSRIVNEPKKTVPQQKPVMRRYSLE